MIVNIVYFFFNIVWERLEFWNLIYKNFDLINLIY